MTTITSQDLAQRLEQSPGDATLIDVRTPAEFEDAHISGSKLVPLQNLDVEQVRSYAETGTVYVVCRSGARATQAINKLNGAGVSNLVLLEGGILSWMNANLPVKRGEKRVLPLDRQALIGAGGLNLIAAILGLTVHPAFFGLNIFIGCGLLMAGSMNICLMAILLARMPWNQRSSDQSCCGCSTPVANRQQEKA